MKKGHIVVVIAIFFLVQLAQAVAPRQWEIRTKSEFLKGKFNGISISDEDFLSLAPR